ncbi:LuxR C-terminal-related transcriptional regulator [soil metagenome]
MLTRIGSPGRRSPSISIGLSSDGLSSATHGFTELADQLAEISSAQSRSALQFGEQLSEALTAVLEALARIRTEAVPAVLLDRAPRELCATRIFDRVMLSWVRGSTWLPQALYAVDGAGHVTLEIDGVVEALDVALASPLVEAEVVRRRLPALVQDARDEPRTHRPLIERTGSREYVVAPVVTNSTVVALLHADVISGDRPLSAIDRDLLRMFADGVGLSYERAGLAERAELQRLKVAEACEAAVRSLREISEDPVVLAGAPDRALAIIREPSLPMRDRITVPRESGRLSRLTAREREVLSLLASGATNAQLADRLTVAESTVKSHVKHILHKLGAGNRAAAIACYLRESRVDERRLR